MGPTRNSLLVRARGGEAAAWNDLCVVYRPLIVAWLRRQSVPASDLDDLVQEILLKVVRGLPAFEHSGRAGAFRTWLRTIVRSASCDYWKSPARRAQADAGTSAAVLDLLEEPDSPLNRYWEEEHDRYVLRCLLQLIELEFAPATVRAFTRVALEGASGSEVAAELGLSAAAVYAGRSRILRRLRELAEGLLDDIS
jgi:RNA polymerase sigma-70 factor, ECF subfamily